MADDGAGGDTAPPPIDDASRLCLSCGMCCDSTLFFFAGLKPREAARAAKNDFDVVEEDGKARFNQPCHHLDGAACTIYSQWRPHVCGDFRCTLLIKLGKGDIAVSDAVTVVAKARSLLSLLPEDLRTLRAMRSFADAAQGRMREGALSPEDAGTMARAVITLRFLDDNFRKDGKKILSA